MVDKSRISGVSDVRHSNTAYVQDLAAVSKKYKLDEQVRTGPMGGPFCAGLSQDFWCTLKDGVWGVERSETYGEFGIIMNHHAMYLGFVKPN